MIELVALMLLTSVSEPLFFTLFNYAHECAKRIYVVIRLLVLQIIIIASLLVARQCS